jgi:intracellular multiplication protein IcmL
MPNIAPELVLTRNEFYQRCYQQIKLIVVILILIMFLLIGFAVRQNKLLKPMPRYIPTTPDGRLIYDPPVAENHLILSQQKVDPTTGIIVGMPQPIMTYVDLQPFGEQALVLFWAYTAVTEMFDYDYVHYRTVIQDASKYFTPTGHQNFIDALISSKNLETVKARSAVVIPEVNGEVKLIGTDEFSGHFAWHLQVPVKLTYASAQDATPIVQQLNAMMSIARVSTLVSPFYGLAIYKLNFEQIISNQGT